MMIFIGAFLNTEDIWNISEIFNALMVIPNIIAILYITKKEDSFLKLSPFLFYIIGCYVNL